MSKIEMRGNASLLGVLSLLLALILAGGAGAASDEDAADGSRSGVARAAWLLERGALQDLPLTGQRFEQGEIGGGGGGNEFEGTSMASRGKGGVLPVLASLVLPGAGEALLGHKRGYLMMALDIFSWTRVVKNHSDGGDLREAYYAYADEHYSDELLLAAYVEGGMDVDAYYRTNIGTDYFTFAPIADLGDLQNLSLYVTKEEDLREYYENLGKWDQFVFGWDDFVRPDDYEGYTPTYNAKIDLEQPWVSAHREEYRLMRDASNDAFKSRDRWLYLNIGLRLFSVFQTAYLQGLLTGGPDEPLEVSGHEVKIHAQPMGLHRGAVAASVSF